MSNRIRNNKSITGIPVLKPEENCEVKLLQYADDTLFFVSDKRSLEIINEELELFGNVAGPKLNKTKTAVMWLGDINSKWSLNDLGLSWTDAPTKYLGFYISPSMDKARTLNWENKLTKLQRLLDNWRKRKLTLFGRITIVKTLALSQIVHILMVDTIPEKILKRLNCLIYTFIWQTKIEKVKRSIMTKQFEKGGVNMIDLHIQKLSFRLRWLGRTLAATKGMWSKMCLYWFNLLGGLELLLNSNFDTWNIKSICMNQLPTFYIEILEAWLKIKINACLKYQPKVHGVQYEILWHNKNVTFHKNTLYYEGWYQTGIVFLKDIFKNGNFLSTTEIFTQLKTRKSRQKLIFDYTVLRQAIPKIWISNHLATFTKFNNNSLETPKIRIGARNQIRLIQDISTKQFYRLMYSGGSDSNRCCIYWEEIIDTPLHWTKIFKRNLRNCQENKLREFNFKIMYNLLPVNKNLYRWNIKTDGRCQHCGIDEDNLHAFIECGLNKKLFSYLSTIVKLIYDVNLKIAGIHLLKAHKETELDLFLTIAFWCIYKYILLRNKTGKDCREFNLQYLFEREVCKRIEEDMNSKKQYHNLPKQMMYFL